MKRKSSKYAGVHWSENNSRWIASARIKGKKIQVGSFIKEREAADAYVKFTRSRNQKRQYTEREKKYIQNNYIVMNDAQIGVYLNRSTQAIKAARERMGLYKIEVEGIEPRDNNFTNKNRAVEMHALRMYIDSGKGGEIAKERLKLLESFISKKPRIYKTKRRVSLSVIAKVYEMFKSGVGRLEIAISTGNHLSTVCGWINAIDPYTGNRKALMVLDSKINYDG